MELKMNTRKSDDRILLSPKHGLNPSMCCCQFCGKEYGVALLGRLKNDEEAPRRVAHGVCDDCTKVLDQKGLLVIEVRDGESGNNPYRTGRMVGVTYECRQKLGIADEHPACYMPESIFSEMFAEYIAANESPTEAA